MVAITDGAMDSMSTILQRMVELAEQSANGVYSNTQRSALELEFQALGSEINRISLTTEFNGLSLLSEGGNVTFQVGFDGTTNSQVTYSGVQATLNSLGLAATDGGALTFSLLGTTITDAQVAARSSIDAIKVAISSLATSRGKLGAAESRLNASINNLQIARENFKAAESRIRDVDVASEAAELTRLNILQQAASAVLAQANQQPSIALSLLQ
jgi:flagellin